jgi:hypothetical protein
MENLNAATADMIAQYAATSTALDVKIRNIDVKRETLPERIQTIPDADLWSAILAQVQICRE